jgi:hypothetical protein
MAKKALLDADVKLGEKILASLDAAKFPVSAAIWTLTEDYGGWQLVIGTPLYSKGPAEAHGKLITALRKDDPESRDSQEVRLMGNREPFIRELRQRYPNSKLGARISGYIGGLWLDDAVVYRIK